MKYVRRAIIIIFFIPLLLVISVEVFYRYKVNEIRPERIITDISHPQSAIDVLWMSFGESEEISLEKFSATRLLYGFLRVATFHGLKDYSSAFPKGMSIAGQVAKNQFISSKRSSLDRHLNNFIISIWVSNNYTAIDALNYLLNSMYYGYANYSFTEAAKYYFGKKVTELDLSESITLITIARSPTFYNPYCQNDRLLKRAKFIGNKLSQNWPLKYGRFKYSLPEFSSHLEIECKNI